MAVRYCPRLRWLKTAHIVQAVTSPRAKNTSSNTVYTVFAASSWVP